jgi:hypothetical protein
MDDTSKIKEAKWDLEVLLSTEEVTKLGTRPSTLHFFNKKSQKATPQDLQHSSHMRANTDPRKSHNTQHTRIKQSVLCLMQKGTHPSEPFSVGHIKPSPTQNRRGKPLLMGGIKKS